MCVRGRFFQYRNALDGERRLIFKYRIRHKGNPCAAQDALWWIFEYTLTPACFEDETMCGFNFVLRQIYHKPE